MDKRSKYQLEAPRWAQKGLFRFLGLDAGPLEVAKAFFTAREQPSSPPTIQAYSDFYNDETLHLLKIANINWIRVTWSVGFSPKEETPQQEMLKDFIVKCHSEDIKVSAHLSISNLFGENIFAAQPQSRDWIQVTPNGSPLLYLGSEKSFLVCLNNPNWIDYLKKRIDRALEAEVDGFHFDGIPSACCCDLCIEKFRSYSNSVLGVAHDIPPLNLNEKDSKGGEEKDKKILPEVWEQFPHATLAHAMVEIHRYVSGKKFGLTISASAHGHPVNEAGNVLSVQGSKQPGYWGRQWVSNSGFYKYFYTLGGGKKPLQIEKGNLPTGGDLHQSKDLHQAGDSFTPLSLESYHLAIAEAVAFQGNLDVGLRGHFLTDLYFRERRALNLWKGIGIYNQFIRDYEEYLVDTESITHTAVLVSGSDWLVSFNRIFMEGCRIPFDVVLVGASHPTLLGLDRYRLLVIPDGGRIGARSFEALKDYVAGGGNLICLGHNEIYDGAVHSGKNRTLAQSLGFTPSSEEGEGVEKGYGHGTILFFPSSIDIYLKENQKARTDLTNSIDRLQGESVLRLQGPDWIVGSLLQQRERGRMVLHLLNYSSKSVGGIGVRIKLPDDFVKERKICLVSPDQLGVRAFLPAQWREDEVEFTVPELIIYDMIVVGGEMGELPEVASV